MTKRGRPAGKVTREPMQVRLTEKERELLDRAARKEHLETSTWLRQLGLKEAEKILGLI